jgi:hypothetical protein
LVTGEKKKTKYLKDAHTWKIDAYLLQQMVSRIPTAKCMDYIDSIDFLKTAELADFNRLIQYQYIFSFVIQRFQLPEFEASYFHGFAKHQPEFLYLELYEFLFNKPPPEDIKDRQTRTAFFEELDQIQIGKKQNVLIAFFEYKHRLNHQTYLEFVRARNITTEMYYEVLQIIFAVHCILSNSC